MRLYRPTVRIAPILAIAVALSCWASSGLAADEPPPTAETTASDESAAGDEALPPGHPPIRGGYELFGGIRLHGRFDVAYERYGYSDDPGDGKDAFRNFHRFLFLDRRVKGDPFFFRAEVLGLNFYEMGLRLQGAPDEVWRLTLAAGKVFVPFGADPLYHHAYGGRVGFDQRVLPAVWADYGLKAALALDLDPVALKLDAFALRGYALRKPDDVLDLRTHSAPLDDLNFAGGGRISATLGPATLSYSFYGGTLDHDRSLFMQSVDLTVWRIDLPVLEDIALTLGGMRADIFGGDLPAYYNFADYLQLRYYVTDCLYVQYRAGLDTRDNRSGVFADGSRTDRFDTSAHSLAVGWVRGNFSLVIQNLWQLELVDEQDDDFLRVTATYEF